MHLLLIVIIRQSFPFLAYCLDCSSCNTVYGAHQRCCFLTSLIIKELPSSGQLKWKWGVQWWSCELTQERATGWISVSESSRQTLHFSLYAITSQATSYWSFWYFPSFNVCARGCEWTKNTVWWHEWHKYKHPGGSFKVFLKCWFVWVWFQRICIYLTSWFVCLFVCFWKAWRHHSSYNRLQCL